MAKGAQQAVAGGMNLSTPTVSGPNGLSVLGMPQTSQLSGLQRAYGAMSGDPSYQMVSSPWQQLLQQHMSGQQPQGGIVGGLMGLMGGGGGQGGHAAMIGKLLGLL